MLIFLIIELINIILLIFVIGMSYFWIFLVITFLFLIYYLQFGKWRATIRKERPKISFYQFITLYKITPEHFNLAETCLQYKNRTIDFKTFWDYCGYQVFLKYLEMKKTKTEQSKNQAWLIKNLQQDLAAKQEENDQWVKENLKKNVHIGQTSF